MKLVRLAIVIWLTANSLPVIAQLSYSISYSDSSSYKVHVSIKLASPKKGPVSFIMPRSVPGTYSMVAYDHFIEQLKAFGVQGENIPMLKNDDDDAPRWASADNVFISGISYLVDLRKMEQRLAPADASIIRTDFAGLLNYSMLGWVEGTEKEKVECTVNTFDNWPIFCTLVPRAQMVQKQLSFSAANYYELADGQLFLGPMTRVKEFKGLVPLYIVSYCEPADEYLDDYGKQGIRSMEILKDYFGDIPFNNYSILLRKAIPLEPQAVPPFGMEHLQSSTFFGDTSGFRFGPMSEQQVVATMPTYLHHMGHAYIPLRSYGDAYRPYVKEIPPIIENIWFNEGFMWFLPVDALGMEKRAKLIHDNTYNAAPEILNMTLTELSRAASLMYASDFRLGKAVYSRGASMAMEMNNYIKEKTGGQRSMKEVLRYIYEWSKQNKRPFTMSEFPELLNKASGLDLGPIYQKWQGKIK